MDTIRDFRCDEITVAQRHYREMSDDAAWCVRYEEHIPSVGWRSECCFVNEVEAETLCRRNGVALPTPAVNAPLRSVPKSEPLAVVYRDVRSLAAGDDWSRDDA